MNANAAARAIFGAVLMIAVSSSRSKAQEVFLSDSVDRCIKSPKAAGLTVLTDKNPFYLRGDCDGDGKPDYALEVRSAKGGSGVLVCAGSGRLFVLGAGRFAGMPNDNFLAPQRAVYTKQDVAALRSFRSNVPQPVPSTKGEAIAMIWEDGFSLIWWDGSRFRWAGSKE